MIHFHFSFLSLRRHSTDIAQPFHVDLEVVRVCDMHISLTPSQWSVKAAFIGVVRIGVRAPLDLGGGAETLLPEKNYTMPERMCCANALKSQ